MLRTLTEVLRKPLPRPVPEPFPSAEPGSWAPGDNGPVPEIYPLMRQLLEFLAGRRPHTQLSPWLAPGALAQLETQRARISPLGPALRRLRIHQPVRDTLEVVALLNLRTGVRALAARLRRDAPTERWRLVAVDIALTPGDRLAVRRAG